MHLASLHMLLYMPARSWKLNVLMVHISHSTLFSGRSGFYSNSEPVWFSPPYWDRWTKCRVKALFSEWSSIPAMMWSIPQHKIIWATAHSCRSDTLSPLAWLILHAPIQEATVYRLLNQCFIAWCGLCILMTWLLQMFYWQKKHMGVNVMELFSSQLLSM